MDRSHCTRKVIGLKLVGTLAMSYCRSLLYITFTHCRLNILKEMNCNTIHIKIWISHDALLSSLFMPSLDWILV
jgi:hypothetical protein